MKALLIAIYDVGSPEHAKNYGVIEVDSDMRIVGFKEKLAQVPQVDKAL